MVMPEELRACADHAEDWLFGAAAPLWCERGRLSNGLFVEKLTLQGKPARAPLRLRVQARQIYAFCELGRLGWTGPWRDVAEHGLRRLLETGRRDDGFFIHQFDENGQPADQRADLYDHAFVLFAFAHAERALKQPSLIAEAHALMDHIDARWKNPSGGYNEGEIDLVPPRWQNPHMHLFEAALALHSIAHDPRWKHLSDSLFALFANTFRDRQTGAVREYFGMDWTLTDDPKLRFVEPGHCFEWAWLVERHGGAGSITLADQMIAFARTFGIDAARNVAIYSVNLDGSPRDRSARLWAQTERLKASLAKWRRDGRSDEAGEAVRAYRGLVQYFETPVRGVWRDRLNMDGTFVEEDAPASSFYHIVCALSELIGAARS